MSHSIRRWGCVVLGLLAFTSAAGAQALGSAESFRERLPRVAAAYRDYGRVDDELRWAPILCRIALPSRVRVSGAEAAHARKVYFVYASDRAAYMRRTTDEPGAALPVGFTVVKESFLPRRGEGRVDPFDPAPADGAPAPHPYMPLFGPDGALTLPGERAGLYVMQFVGRNVPGTDEGWLYGTIAASGEVTAAGRVESCMGCHTRAPHDRLFGLGPASAQ